jgi:hypothetical protein
MPVVGRTSLRPLSKLGLKRTRTRAPRVASFVLILVISFLMQFGLSSLAYQVFGAKPRGKNEWRREGSLLENHRLRGRPVTSRPLLPFVMKRRPKGISPTTSTGWQRARG